MRAIMMGFSGWVRMQDGRSDSVRVVDTGLTVVATLLVALTWVILRH
jgi:hypothetical protein